MSTDTVPGTAPALDLQGIADFLGVNFWRVRKWRRNAINSIGERRLVRPDVVESPPRWSPRAVQKWADGEGLWPPGADQYWCSVCGLAGSVYTEAEQIMRDHGWRFDPAKDLMVACPGSGMPAKSKAQSRVPA